MEQKAACAEKTDTLGKWLRLQIDCLFFVIDVIVKVITVCWHDLCTNFCGQKNFNPLREKLVLNSGGFYDNGGFRGGVDKSCCMCLGKRLSCGCVV